MAVALVAAASVAAALGAGARSLQRQVADEVRRRVVAAGASVESVGLSWRGPVLLEGVRVERPDVRVTATRVDVSWGMRGDEDARSHVRGFAVRGLRVEHGAMVATWPQAAFAVVSWERSGDAEHVRLRQSPGGGELDLRWSGPRDARRAALSLSALDLSLARVSWAGEAMAEPGRWTGTAALADAPGRVETDGQMSADAVRVALRGVAGETGDLGVPTAVRAEWSLSRGGEALEVRHATVRLDGLEVSGEGRLEGPAAGRRVEARVSTRADVGAAFRTAGLRLPGALAGVPAGPLGTAYLDVSVRGPLDDPAALEIAPRLRFEPTPAGVAAFAFLRRPFRLLPEDPDGVPVEVKDGAPGFVPLVEVPPLFVRALLVSEDAGFFGHPGIDVAEIPVAWATNVERGSFARGASTITQQLVKNLFLSREKSYGRKVEEAALALLVDAAVPKTRLLEIYLNVIEWGPGLHGIGPAARHYFGKEPAALTPKEIAFLVCLIPSPVRYHQAHVAGHVGPGMELLMAGVLAKLRSVDALTEAEYEEALAEALAFRPEDGVPVAVQATRP